MILMTRPRWRMPSSSSISSTRSSTRSPRPAASPGRILRGIGNADLRRRPVRLFVPFVGRGDEIAVGVARGDVGEHGRGQGAGVVQLLVALFHRAFVGEFAQHALELGAHGVLETEGAGDFAGADLAGLRANEGENVSFGGEGVGFGLFVQNESPAPNDGAIERNVVIERGFASRLFGSRLGAARGLGLGGDRGRLLCLGRSRLLGSRRRILRARWLADWRPPCRKPACARRRGGLSANCPWRRRAHRAARSLRRASRSPASCRR